MTTFPTFYNPQRIGTLFYPDMNGIASAAATANLPAASADKTNIHPVRPAIKIGVIAFFKCFEVCKYFQEAVVKDK